MSEFKGSIVSLFALIAFFTRVDNVLAYLPTEWSEEHAKSDATGATCCVVGRVFEVKEQRRPKAKGGFHVQYYAGIRIGMTLKGKIDRNEIHLLIGESTLPQQATDSTPTFFSLLGTNAGLMLQVNVVYCLFLVKGSMDDIERGLSAGWRLRSGPYSLYRVEQFGEGEGLVVRTSSEGELRMSRASWEVSGMRYISLEEFLRRTSPRNTPVE